MDQINRYIPNHLKKYIVKQDYDSYSFIDHACWRYIMKISIDYFSKHADQIYNKGLDKTGITKNKIPRITSINKKLTKLGWKAVCVRGFIPPQIFMEFQSLRVLPIAADMRTHKHLTYTPAPDIVHEAAGHAPILANKEYSKYLIDYGEIASKAIISSEDMDLYYAIRDLSDIKENINATKYKIKKCEEKLKNAYKNISYVSESSTLSRMNWWTVEYGLIGNLNAPKIYGAGLLSSVSESENCFLKNVKKIKLDINCINYSYDITEQQPQLFVTPSYQHLRKVLNDLSERMSYKIGGIFGLKTAIKAKTICTVEIDNHLYISGKLVNYKYNNDNITFLKFNEPVQLSYKKRELQGHGINYHSHGYSTPLGQLKNYNKSIDQLKNSEIKKLNLQKKQIIKLTFIGGIHLIGKIENIIKRSSKIILITFNNCTVKQHNKILFKPEWGKFDMLCGTKITSVYGGPADVSNYYKYINVENKYKKKPYNNLDKKLNDLYMQVKKIRQKKLKIINLKYIYKQINLKYENEWLLKYEVLELAYNTIHEPWVKTLYNDLKELSYSNNDYSGALERGLLLLDK